MSEGGGANQPEHRETGPASTAATAVKPAAVAVGWLFREPDARDTFAWLEAR